MSFAISGNGVAGRAQVDLQRLRRAHGVPFVLGDDRDEVLLAHDARAGMRLDRAFVDRDGRTPRVGGRIMRACSMPST